MCVYVCVCDWWRCVFLFVCVTGGDVCDWWRCVFMSVCVTGGDVCSCLCV